MKPRKEKKNEMNKFSPGYCATKRRKAAGRMMGTGGKEERGGEEEVLM